jgi:thiol-disulfide isomerase/thioredoxin
MTRKHIVLTIVALIIIGSIVVLENGTTRPTGPTQNTDIVLESTSTPQATTAQATAPSQTYLTPEQKALKYPRAKEISTPDAFINVPSITVKGELDTGNIVLVDFWTYSCINCQRTLPYLNAWHKAYGNKGLTIIGMHTPEFDFEKELENVQKAVAKFGITYPVVLDNDFSTWQSYGNQYWPRKYLIDTDGFIVYDHIGEGGYADTEKEIRKLLAERAARLGVSSDLPTTLVSTTVAADTATGVQTPETYFGALRNEFIGNVTQGKIGKQDAIIPDTRSPNTTYLDGTWNIENEYAESVGSGKIVLTYQAKIINFVASSETPMTISVSQDGKHVKDIVVQDATLYELVRNETAGQHTIEISIPKSGLQAFTFTFG